MFLKNIKVSRTAKKNMKLDNAFNKITEVSDEVEKFAEQIENLKITNS